MAIVHSIAEYGASGLYDSADAGLNHGGTA